MELDVTFEYLAFATFLFLWKEASHLLEVPEVLSMTK